MEVKDVVHCKQAAYDVYIGRPSKWGNPFHISNEVPRFAALELYRAWLLSHVDMLEQLPELDGKILGCWCKPLDCHGDILAELIQMIHPNGRFYFDPDKVKKR